MPAGTPTIYAANKDDLRLQDLAGATLKIALLANTYVPDFATNGHAVLADVVAHEIAAGNGYVAGGVALPSIVLAAIAGGWKLSSGNAAWVAAGGNIAAWRYALLYVSGSLWGKVNPLIWAVVGDTTSGGTDVPATVNGQPLQVVCPGSGWLDIV